MLFYTFFNHLESLPVPCSLSLFTVHTPVAAQTKVSWNVETVRSVEKYRAPVSRSHMSIKRLRPPPTLG
jgi:hypothetical protein